MPEKRFNAEQVVALLRQIEVAMSAGKRVAPKEPAKSAGTVSNDMDIHASSAPTPDRAQKMILPSLKGILVVRRAQDVVKVGTQDYFSAMLRRNMLSTRGYRLERSSS